MEGIKHMASICFSSRMVVPVRRAGSLLTFFLTLIGCAATTSSFAGQFSRLAHARYIFIGVVTEAKAIAKPPIGELAGSKHSVRKTYYVKASVSPEKILMGTQKIAMSSQSLSICATAISVGATYLFVSNGPEGENGCSPSVLFLLGTLPGKAPNSSIILTEDTLFMLPESPDLVQRSVALPDAHIHENDCKRNVGVLNTYLDLRNFLDLLKHERAKVETPDK